MKGSLTLSAALAVLLGGCYVVATPEGMAVGVAPVVAVATPSMTFIPNTSIQIVSAPGVAGDVFFHNGVYWRCYNGIWYRRARWGGTWLTVGSVPRVFLSIPRTHRAFRAVRHHPLYKRPVKVQRSSPGVKGSVKRGPVKKPTAKRVVVPGKKKRDEKEKKKVPWMRH